MNDKNDWVATVEAVKYRFGPFIAPHPSEELGLGPNHRSSLGRSSNQIRPLTSSGPRRGEADAPLSTWNGSRRSHVQDISTPRSHGTHPSVPRRRDSQDPAFSARVMSNPPERRQVISLSERFPGDQTHRPLDIIRHESKRAHRSPHLRRGHIPGPDSIDRLDIIGAAYHHEGPYDAALLARNRSHKSSPLQAVRASNEEALKATPMEKIQDSIERHRPLDGVATIPPGMRDLSGRVMQYEEGSNMMIEDGGNYKRWPGVVRSYHRVRAAPRPLHELIHSSSIIIPTTSKVRESRASRWNGL